MSAGKYTVVYSIDGTEYKLCKIWFGNDGSYYVSCPYHTEDKALVAKARVNFARQDSIVRFEDLVDMAALDDDERRLKLSHHPDGFVQFSGHGVISGRLPDGSIKGVGLLSWPLVRPTRGPSFALVVRGIVKFQRHDRTGSDPIRFRAEDAVSTDVIVMEGHYLPPLWRRFIRVDPSGEQFVMIAHPSGAVIRLRAVLAPESCALGGFIGLDLYHMADDDPESGPGFTLSGPTGAIAKNADDEWEGDAIFCHYPRMEKSFGRWLNYRLPELK